MTNLRILGLAFGVFALVGIRHFESFLFYDPLNHFFQMNYQTGILPDLDWTRWGLSLVMRYVLNSFFSLMILFALFKRRSMIRFSTLLFTLILLILLPFLLWEMYHYKPGEYRILFYIRRFLIHPLLVLLLIPGFWLFKTDKNT